MIVQMCIMIMLVGMSMNWGVSDSEAIVSKSLYSLLKIENQGVIRGVNFEMTRKNILDIETNATITRENNSLIVHEPIGGLTKEDLVKVKYKFGENGLYLITVEAFQRNKVDIHRLHKALEKHFNDKLTLSDDHYDGFQIWNGTDEASETEYMVLMRDKSAATDGRLSLEFYAM